MSFLTGSPKGSWEPIMTVKTNTQSYWINWRVLLCAIWVLLSIIFSSLLLWKYEKRSRNVSARNGSGREKQEENSAILYEDETWKPCLKGIHPAWLLAFRVFAFIVLLVLLIVNVVVDGGEILLYYTQWTFASITFYFGLGSILSMHGCYQHHKKSSGDNKVDNVDGDAEQGIFDVHILPQSSNASDQEKNLGASEEVIVRQHAGTWGYIFQITFQINAGAALLTDCVFWFVFVKMKEPNWSDNTYPTIDFQDICYYSAPKNKPSINSLEEADPELLRYFDKLGVPLNEQNRLANVAVDAVLDSVSIATTHRKTLEKAGVIFCSISDAVKEYPDLVRSYLGQVVPSEDNYYAALNAAVFSDGSFCYIPKGVKCPMQISTYFRINALETGQFERTLIVADDRSMVEYLEGCTAPSYDKNQLHAAVVELYCGEGAEIKYSTVQNWYAGDENGKGGIYNFVTKRGLCAGKKSKISWTQVETGSAITWKYPSVVLEGDESVGEFYSVALTNNYQQADTGTKMIHKGKNTKSRIISKGISAGHSRNCYRGLVQVQSKAENAKNSSQCDSMLIGDSAAANTYPYIQVKNPSARIEHEASTSKIGEDQLFYFQQRGIDYEKAMAAMISGFCRDVFNELPDEFGSEVNQLMSLKLEGSVG